MLPLLSARHEELIHTAEPTAGTKYSAAASRAGMLTFTLVCSPLVRPPDDKRQQD